MNTIEISVDSLESAMAAEQGGAHRVELCCALREGGLTPSLGLIRAVRAHLAIDVFVLIRSRSGGFLYTDEELRIMREDIAIASQEGINGVVLGALTADGQVDIERTSTLVEKARPMQVTFHRAFDMVRDQHEALEQVVQCGADRILTSGGQASATLGQDRLRELSLEARGRVVLLGGGGVRPQNVAELALATGLREFHSSMRHTQQSAMRFRASQLHLGEPGADEYARTCVLAEDVRSLVDAAQALTDN